MAFSEAARNAMLDNEITRMGFVSLHTADPGLTGASEATGGSPAYARKAATWSAAATANVNLSNAPVFDVPAGTYVWGGVWTLATGGVFQGGFPLSATEVYASQGTYTLTDANLGLLP